MRFSLLLVLLWAGLSMTSFAQTHQHKPKAKPHHDREFKQQKSVVPLKGAAKADSSASQQLRKIEQEGAKSQGAKKGQAEKLKPVKLPHEKPNAPIRVSGGAKGDHGSMATQGANPYKGRLRQKGSHHR